MTLTWSRDLPAPVWDRHLAAMGGHPLQSALWGDARERLDGIRQQRWAAFAGGEPVLMARFESRSFARIGRAAWLPKGPAAADAAAARTAFDELLRDLRTQGFWLCIDDQYALAQSAGLPGIPLRPARTAWIDLTAGHDTVWNALDKQWRYGVRAAGRAGVVVEQSREGSDIAAFFDLYQQISERKAFDLSGSRQLLESLIAAPASGDIEARLFVARSGREMAAGAVVLRSGSSIHYFWGGVDRRFPRHRAGEAVQWAVIEWALANGLTRYDLEGIDPSGNPGTYKFKIKMGAREVALRGTRAYPLSTAGRLALRAGLWTGRI